MALDPLTAALDFGGIIIEKIFPDPTAQAQAKLKLFELQQTGELALLTAETDIAKGQMAINSIEAGSDSKFKSWWRPFIGWVCGIAFCYHFVLQPFMVFIITAIGYPVELPIFNMTELSTVLFGLLGLGGLRTVEKLRK